MVMDQMKGNQERMESERPIDWEREILIDSSGKCKEGRERERAGEKEGGKKKWKEGKRKPRIVEIELTLKVTRLSLNPSSAIH